MSAAERFDTLVRPLCRRANVTASSMFGAPGLKVNGRFFAVLYREQLVVKLPRERASALVASAIAQPFEPGHGRTMKEWITVPVSGARRWSALAEEALSFVSASGAAAGARPTVQRARSISQ